MATYGRLSLAPGFPMPGNWPKPQPTDPRPNPYNNPDLSGLPVQPYPEVTPLPGIFPGPNPPRHPPGFDGTMPPIPEPPIVMDGDGSFRPPWMSTDYARPPNDKFMGGGVFRPIGRPFPNNYDGTKDFRSSQDNEGLLPLPEEAYWLGTTGGNPNPTALSPYGTPLELDHLISNDTFDDFFNTGQRFDQSNQTISNLDSSIQKFSESVNRLADVQSKGAEQMADETGGGGADTGYSFDLNNFLSGLGLLGGLGLGATGLKGAYDRLGAIGEAAQQGALGIGQAGLEQTQFQPFTVTSGMGGVSGVGADGSVNIGMSPQEQAIQRNLMRTAQRELGRGPFGLGMGRDASSSAFGLGQQFMDQAGMGTEAREQAVFDRIRAMQQPEEQRQQLALEERLQAQGRGGVRTNMFGGTPEQFAMSKAQAEAQNAAALQAMSQAQAQQAQQAQLGQAFTGLGSQLSAQDLAMRTGQQQLGMGALGGAYMPQAQAMNLIQQGLAGSQLAQKGQLYGAGLFGEASMGGLEALLGAGLGQANLFGQLGTGLMTSGVESAQDIDWGDFFGDIWEKIK